MTLLKALAVALCAVSALAVSYDPDAAWNSLYYSKAAYCNHNDLTTWGCGPSCDYHSGFQVQGVYHNGTFDAQGYTGYNPSENRIVVAFRGSSNIPNWIADFDFILMDYPNANCQSCQVHAGFYQVYLEMSGQMLSDVSTLVTAHPTATVLVTGHSLGAAVSVHAAVDISTKIKGYTSLEVYNFGEPRVGNPAFAAWAASVLPDGKQFRVTHAADPVPHLPPIVFGYLHTPHELWYNNDGNTSFAHCDDSATSESPDCSDSTLPIDVFDHTLYLGMCTGCDCDSFNAEQYRNFKVTIPTKKSANPRVLVSGRV